MTLKYLIFIYNGLLFIYIWFDFIMIGFIYLNNDILYVYKFYINKGWVMENTD